MIIAIEGIDGAGKNTLVTALVEKLDATVTCFPRYADSIHAQLAQRALYGQMGDLTDSAYAMATLFALDRHEALPQLRRFAHAPEVLLLDRYVASNAAYSAARTRNAEMVDWVADLEFNQLGLPVPNLQVLLNTPPELAAQRASVREQEDETRTRDRYESDSGLQQRTAGVYQTLAESNWYSPWIIARPEQDVAEISEQIVAAVS
ncbi:MAG: dTMP kinase [Corynebacterium sp.]|uniref:dTMP kinase n=1 Tax=Corynebacterium sp. TaxID=1720 RepID=UPI0026DC959B|nr:dTMP kinase [Corynebacterium sp.]MDO5097597.1 dTMP kinase [Corynebacterium sp.]